MKFARFRRLEEESKPELGVISNNFIVPMASGSQKELPDTIHDIMEKWPDIREDVRLILQGGTGLPLSEVELLAPIARPSKILAQGLNYADHVAESGLSRPEHQTWFCKQPSSVNGPYSRIEIPRVSTMLDYEAELVVVIGRGGRHIERMDAPDHVFGYCVGNDLSVRDWQMRTSQWMLGKSFDTHAPFGPWITTSDEIGDPHCLEICCFVNGELRQKSNTRHLIFGVWDMIAQLSQVLTLEPGDLIFTGTPGGVGFSSRPQAMLKVGDLVRCEIEGLSWIENLVVDEA